MSNELQNVEQQWEAEKARPESELAGLKSRRDELSASLAKVNGALEETQGPKRQGMTPRRLLSEAVGRFALPLRNATFHKGVGTIHDLPLTIHQYSP